MPNKTVPAPKTITVELTPVEHAALLVVAAKGLKAVEAFDLVQNTGAMEAAIRKVRDAAR